MSNILHITADHTQGRVRLYGDTAVVFDTALTDTFLVRLFTVTDEIFTFNTPFQFQWQGSLVDTFTFGGRSGMSLDLMFDPTSQIWYPTRIGGQINTEAGMLSLVTDYPWEANPV